MQEIFDLAVDGDRVFRVGTGPETMVSVEPDDAPSLDGLVVEHGSRPVKLVQRSLFESAFALGTWRLTAGDPERVDEADPLTGYLAQDAGTRLVQARLTDRISRSPHFFGVSPGEGLRTNPQPVLEAAKSAIVSSAPEGWRALTIECRALGGRMELTALVTFPDGQDRSWSPPAMVSQWLHRLRMRTYGVDRGAWFTARLELTPGGPGSQRFSIDDKPVWQVPGAHDNRFCDASEELGLLPRSPRAIPPWLMGMVLHTEVKNRLGTYVDVDWRPDPGGITESVRLFDGRDAQGRPAWFRPTIDRHERDAILRYLENAPLVLSSRGLTKDVLADRDEPAVPMGFHTDGRWVWPSAVAYYLREHRVPPAPDLMDHIRHNGYRLPVEVPRIAMTRAAALAMGQPVDDSRVAAEFDDAMRLVSEVIRDYQISPRFYSIGVHRDQAWCVVRDHDWYDVYWADGEHSQGRMRFGDVRKAATYLMGQFVTGQNSLRFGENEEIPWWQSPYQSLSEFDPPLEAFGEVMVTTVVDAVVDRYGTPEGNLVYVADTPFEQRGLPADHAEREYHRYRLPGAWTVTTAVAQAGGRLYLLPDPVGTHVANGQIEDLTAPQSSAGHPGLPPVTDALVEEAKRSPGGWVWCADPDVDPRYIEGAPNFTLLGAYKVGPTGELTGEMYLNDDYRPSPRKLGFPEPQSEFELVLGFVAAGWLPQERILPAALNSEFLLETDGEGALRLGVDAQGRRFLAVYSSPRYLPAEASSPMQAEGKDLIGALAGATLVINPGGELGIELPGDDLIAASG